MINQRSNKSLSRVLLLQWQSWCALSCTMCISLAITFLIRHIFGYSLCGRILMQEMWWIKFSNSPRILEYFWSFYYSGYCPFFVVSTYERKVCKECKNEQIIDGNMSFKPINAYPLEQNPSTGSRVIVIPYSLYMHLRDCEYTEDLIEEIPSDIYRTGKHLKPSRNWIKVWANILRNNFCGFYLPLSLLIDKAIFDIVFSNGLKIKK